MLKEPSSLRPSTGSSACSQPSGHEWNDRERRCLTDLGLRACMTARSRHTKAAIAEFNDALRGVVEVMVDSKSGNAKDIVQGATELTDEFGERLWLSPALQDRPWLFEAAPVFSMNYERIKGLLAKLLQAMLDARQHRSAVVEDSGGQLSAETYESRLVSGQNNPPQRRPAVHSRSLPAKPNEQQSNNIERHWPVDWYAKLAPGILVADAESLPPTRAEGLGKQMLQNLAWLAKYTDGTSFDLAKEALLAELLRRRSGQVPKDNTRISTKPTLQPQDVIRVIERVVPGCANQWKSCTSDASHIAASENPRRKSQEDVRKQGTEKKLCPTTTEWYSSSSTAKGADDGQPQKPAEPISVRPKRLEAASITIKSPRIPSTESVGRTKPDIPSQTSNDTDQSEQAGPNRGVTAQTPTQTAHANDGIGSSRGVTAETQSPATTEYFHALPFTAINGTKPEAAAKIDSSRRTVNTAILTDRTKTSTSSGTDPVDTTPVQGPANASTLASGKTRPEKPGVEDWQGSLSCQNRASPIPDGNASSDDSDLSSNASPVRDPLSRVASILATTFEKGPSPTASPLSKTLSKAALQDPDFNDLEQELVELRLSIRGDPSPPIEIAFQHCLTIEGILDQVLQSPFCDVVDLEEQCQGLWLRSSMPLGTKEIFMGPSQSETYVEFLRQVKEESRMAAGGPVVAAVEIELFW
ncbi:hypothetical protein CLAFUW4_11016 [Fulvia fulva]|nr:hypothetical protein CLAFUR4_11021 [Fulvia fulva]KAK4621192.1 hypothetical protein CLAFUR0_11028 [Fulvia fulva]WPV17056.1 hypothetical protein CLAFUW4_11016 [Fulvia fulva]WPV32053.1 hypothetical protein CLAFUW7_11014 [Fulvia fulva]